MSLKVIGAGWGRTGTSSLRDALALLGFRTHHMVELFAHPEQVGLFTEATTDPDFDWSRIYRPYTATTDWPGAAFWRELAAAYPAAKVLLTVRDPQRWYDSWSHTLLPHLRDGRPGQIDWNEMAQRVVVARSLRGAVTDREAVIAAYLRHQQEVRESIPAERLLVYDVGQGWQPLCEFLDVPVPEQPFPSVNDRVAFLSRQTAG